MEETNSKAKSNWFIKIWNYFTTYEKIWLLVLCGGGTVITILFPGEVGWLRIFELITLIGGCVCELLLSKQCKWSFIISFFFYDLTETVVYFAGGYYVSALFEIIFWMPMLFISFYYWDKRLDKENKELTVVHKIDYKKELTIFIIILASSFGVGAIFTCIGFISEGLSDYWWVDAIANTFSVCNGLFLWLRYREQWIAWFAVCVCEAFMWIVAGNWVMLILILGYLTNTTYGLLKWNKYIKDHKNMDLSVNSNENNQPISKQV